jgi:hypothetical protein
MEKNIGLQKTVIEGLTLYHEVPNLGSGVAENITAMIKHYGSLASRDQLPPVSLLGAAFAEPWDTLIEIEGCSGNSGPSDEELRNGSEWYECLALAVPASTSPRFEFHPTTLEGVIAHEIAHLRWRQLRHGPEFNARVLGLLRGANFSPRGRWSRSTEKTMAQTRREIREILSSLLKK